MNKKLLLGLSLLTLIVGAVFLIGQKQEVTSPEVVTERPTAANICPPSNKATTSTQGISPGSYVTLSEYKKDCAKFSNTNIVYFFHATWCPTCQGIEKEITADMARIPVGVTIVKTDYDTEKDLKAKYGVTVQTTFVQIDKNGDKIAKYTAANLADAVAGIK
jgi:thiol-disulfide isomerase/thioredoxin